MNPSDLLFLLDLIGVAVFAISGALVAGRKSLDLLGVIVIAVVTAIGGGTIRDVLLGRSPIFWLQNTIYLWVIIGAAAFTTVYTRYRKPPLKALLIADAFGLALFTVSGTQIAQQLDLPWLSAVLMGAITGAAGGVIRDVLCAEIPLILRRDIYATAALAGGGIFVVLQSFGIGTFAAGLVASVVIVALRFAAIFWGLRLPTFQVRGEGE
ncbi:MAG TPA: trimeric intracellular cation channel family protein [Rhodothermales bacterium]|nr:trimeric intracellular cation channel family protein [Rhodothermales bacterium]